MKIRHSHYGHAGYYTPRTCRELRQALRKAGITRISGRPLGQVRKAQLVAVWRRKMEAQQ